MGKFYVEYRKHLRWHILQTQGNFFPEVPWVFANQRDAWCNAPVVGEDGVVAVTLVELEGL